MKNRLISIRIKHFIEVCLEHSISSKVHCADSTEERLRVVHYEERLRVVHYGADLMASVYVEISISAVKREVPPYSLY